MSEEIQQTTETQETEQTTVNLSLGDLATALQAIQLASTRGAFRAEEFTQVGGCYERIFAFLEANGAIKRNAPADEGSSDAPVESEGGEA